MSVYGGRYRNSFQDVAKELIKTVPWYAWPKGKAGETLYDSILVLAYYSPRTVDAWVKKHPECYYDVSRNSNSWYWIALWASQNNLDYYLERC
jgi:hypothetical protein